MRRLFTAQSKLRRMDEMEGTISEPGARERRIQQRSRMIRNYRPYCSCGGRGKYEGHKGDLKAYICQKCEKILFVDVEKTLFKGKKG